MDLEQLLAAAEQEEERFLITIEAGMERSVMAALARKAPITHFDPEDISLRERSFLVQNPLPRPEQIVSEPRTRPEMHQKVTTFFAHFQV